MIKRSLIVLFFFTTAITLPAQPRQDSNFVKQLLARADKVLPTSDSFEVLTTQALQAAEKIGFTKGIQEATDGLAGYYYQTGRLSHSLQYLLQNEESAIAVGDSALLFKVLRLQSTIYQRIGDFNMVRSSVMRRQAILDKGGIKNVKDTSYETISQYNTLAHYYAAKQVNKPDSVEYFYRKMNRLGKTTSFANLWLQLSEGGIGNVFLRKNNADSAIKYLRRGMAVAWDGNRYDNYYGYMISLSEAFRKAGKLDSSLIYAYSAYNGAVEQSLRSLLASATGQLAKSYTDKKQYDSAVKYMTLERDYKDSVAGTETLNNIQFLTNDYQLKSLEKQREKEAAINQYKATLKNYFFLGGVILLLAIIAAMYRVNKQRAKARLQIEKAYQDLKAAQAQLVQSEKMASLGELTAGIAHEIQNPLNFVNNFSDLSSELLDEMKEEITKGNYSEVNALAANVQQNLEKINQHGKRADAIVKGMLLHSRNSTGQKESTDINALADEYLRLCYHGLRARDKSFNATIKTDFEATLGNIHIVSQDVGRVIMNLLTNAFYAVNARKALNEEGYEPTVSISTKRIDDHVLITVSDNGLGIPATAIDKIFQPFFTTKPAGQGTGLGLSLSYDIITKGHGGELKVETKEARPGNQLEQGQGTTFMITLPT